MQVLEQPTTKNLLLTGPPACGKTTAVLRTVERLSDLRPAGFYTREIREQGGRVGFEAVGISTGTHAFLAHVRSRSRHRRPPRLRAGGLGPVVEAARVGPAGEVDLFAIDEVGKMELLCQEFVAAVGRLLDRQVPLLAKVALKGLDEDDDLDDDDDDLDDDDLDDDDLDDDDLDDELDDEDDEEEDEE